MPGRKDVPPAPIGPYACVQKYVASRSLRTVDWNNSVLLEGDAAEAVARLKAADGPMLAVHGSSDLIQTLLAHDLVDEIRVWTFPVTVGPGKQLFGDGTQAGAFQVVTSTTSTTGVVITTYRRDGQIDGGSFAFQTPTDDEVVRRQRLAAEEAANR